MEGAVLTRFHSEDYKVFFAPGLYADFLKKVEAVGFSRAMDDTKPGMLYWQEKPRSWLWVTGIPSARKDRIGTPIRFNLLLTDSDAVIRNWGAYCLALLSSPADGGLRRLGEAWDALIVDNQAFRAGVGFSHLFACLEQVLQTGFEGGLSQQLVKDYCILSPLVPEAEFIRDVLIDTSLQGAVWSRGRLEEVPAAKKKILPSSGDTPPQCNPLLTGVRLLVRHGTQLGHDFVENLRDLAGSEWPKDGATSSATQDGQPGDAAQGGSAGKPYRKEGRPGPAGTESRTGSFFSLPQPPTQGRSAGNSGQGEARTRKDGPEDFFKAKGKPTPSAGERREERQERLRARISQEWDDVTSAAKAEAALIKASREPSEQGPPAPADTAKDHPVISSVDKKDAVRSQQERRALAERFSAYK
ncbi:hypothetical protein [Desulfovibrio sp.]|uniref:hypothetical protein n=1 Tax=Desulfovibrio sp. TaxID=885 RepID=UPI003AB6FBF5